MVYWIPKEGTGFYDWQVEDAIREKRLPSSDYTLLEEGEWKALVNKANATGMLIVNDPATNRPILAPPPAPSEEEVLERERNEHEEWLRQHDYVGIKIATGRASREEYADIIAEMDRRAARINEINAILNTGGQQL